MSEAETALLSVEVRGIDIDDVRRDRGVNSRSKFIRQAVRDSVYKTELSPATLEVLLESSKQTRHGEFTSSDEVSEEFLHGQSK